MPVLKSRTVDGVRVTLHRLEGDRGLQHDYEVRLDGHEDSFANTKQDAERQFENTVDILETQSRRDEKPSGGGMSRFEAAERDILDM